jgi:multiple antibiotic resistance protein
VVPLAIPLLAGPGSISTVIIEVHRSEMEFHGLMAIAIIALVCLLLWLVLRMAATIGRILGQTGLNIINRLFGLILAAIAVEIMANGLKQLFPALAG